MQDKENPHQERSDPQPMHRRFYIVELQHMLMRHGMEGLIDWQTVALTSDEEIVTVFRCMVDATEKASALPCGYLHRPYGDFSHLRDARISLDKELSEMMRAYGMLDEEEFQLLIGMHPSRSVPQALAVGSDRIGFRYPRQQVDARRNVFGVIDDIREIVTGDDAIHAFLAKKHALLAGRTGYHALHDGDDSRVVGAAWDYFVS